MFENSPKIEFLSQMQTKKGKCIEKQDLQTGYLGFFKFCFFDPKHLKKSLFLEKRSQNPKFSKFSKNRIICCRASGLQPVCKVSTRYDNF